MYVLNLSAYSDNFISRIYLMIFDSSLEKAIGEASSSLENVQKKEINISGNPGIKLSGNTSDRVLSKNSNQAAVIGIQKENLVYLITSEDNEVLKKLVSTIKFE